MRRTRTREKGRSKRREEGRLGEGSRAGRGEAGVSHLYQIIEVAESKILYLTVLVREYQRHIHSITRGIR